MVAETTENNSVEISGKVTTELKYSHEIYGEGFYHFLLEVPRLSDSNDNISITISERLIGKRDLPPGTAVNIEGQFRSYNSFGESGSKLLLTVFAREINFVGDEEQIRNTNKIFLNGFICKKPIYRSTPFGREITDLLIAVNRAYNKSDYIPCISWGRNARFCSNLNVGDNIKVWGRIQSRTYQKKMQDGASIARVAYEVSLSKLEMADAKRIGQETDADGAGAGVDADIVTALVGDKTSEASVGVAAKAVNGIAAEDVNGIAARDVNGIAAKNIKGVTADVATAAATVTSASADVSAADISAKAAVNIALS